MSLESFTPFIFSAYIDGQLQNWIDLGRISESEVNAALDLPDNLKGLYSSLKNYPAVMNRRLLIGGSKPPIFDDESLHVEVLFSSYQKFITQNMPMYYAEIFKGCKNDNL